MSSRSARKCCRWSDSVRGSSGMGSRSLTSYSAQCVTLPLGSWSVVSLLRIFQNTLSAEGANDLYVYWYAGHFVRETQDPYRAFLTDQLPTVPIIYLDKTVTDLQDVIVPGWVPAPALTFPLIAALSFFAFLSWVPAKLVWLGFNLVFILIIPPLILRLMGSREAWGRWLLYIEDISEAELYMKAVDNISPYS